MSDKIIYDIAIVGGGIVGLASAYQIQKAWPDLKVVLLEKEDHLAAHQTGHNSGVIHSGLYYKPGTFKAKNCVDGRRKLVAFAKEQHISHDICGKIVVATREDELPFMEKIYNNGLENGVEGVEKIGPKTISEIEPFCTGISGLWVPCTGIIDFTAVARKLGELITGINTESKVITKTEVQSFSRNGDHSEISTSNGTYKAKCMIFCGGLQSDRLAKKDGAKLDMQIVGFRGDYYELTEGGIPKVRNLIYPVPDPKFPFLGVHFTRMIHGGVECGPNAVFTFKREGYGKADFSLRDSLQALTFSGTWKLLFGNLSHGMGEYRRAFSKKLFLKNLQRLIPELSMDDIEPGRAGVRAMALDQDGNMIDDFKIEHTDHSLHVLNAPSPAATACLAIGEEVRKEAKEKLGLPCLPDRQAAGQAGIGK